MHKLPTPQRESDIKASTGNKISVLKTDAECFPSEIVMARHKIYERKMRKFFFP